MDSFTVFFLQECPDKEVREIIDSAGAAASSLTPGEIVASRGQAALWIDSYAVADLASRQYWPVPKQNVKEILSITVRRNEESSHFATEIAHLLATQCGGIISWDGNDHWERLYHRTYGCDTAE